MDAHKIQRLLSTTIVSLIIVVSTACTKQETAEIQVQNGLVFPAYFPDIAYNNPKNRISAQGKELGRLLFYEKALSIDSSLSCGSCHAQTHAFADHNTKVSRGVGGVLGTRSSPALFNLAWNTSFMWDGGANHIEVMPLGPLTAENEMAFSLAGIVARLNTCDYYKIAFKAVFQEDSITDQQLLFALAQFMSSMISDHAKYDEVMQGKATFSADEEAGYRVFQSNCNSCHTEPLFTNFLFKRNGATTEGDDLGRMRITLMEEDTYAFKIPSLRNIILTYPYMHDGKFSTLNQVIEHYNSLENNEFADVSLRQQKSLNKIEKEQLIAFLNTLTDYDFIGNTSLAEIEVENK